MHQEKYTSSKEFLKARLSRQLMRSTIASAVGWRAMENPLPGYTIIIGLKAELGVMIEANLGLLSEQDLEGVDSIVLVFDRVRSADDDAANEGLRARFPKLRLRFVYYSPWQARLGRFFDWGWVYCWMSWAIGIAETKTRWALLHDFDALLLRRETLRERFEAIRKTQLEFLGVAYYEGNGVTAGDRLVRTFELIFDAQFIKHTFRPIDLFNRVARIGDRRVEFDTFIDVQTRGARRDIIPIGEEWLVHPSQMICQYVDHLHGRPIPAATNNLLMIPYFYHLGGDARPLHEITAHLANENAQSVQLFGRELDVGAIDPIHMQWIIKQAFRVERKLHARIRPEVRAYFDAIEGAYRAAPALPRSRSTPIAVKVPSSP